MNDSPSPSAPRATPAPAPSASPRAIEVMAAVLGHVVGIPREQARHAVASALAAGARVLEVYDGRS